MKKMLLLLLVSTSLLFADLEKQAVQFKVGASAFKRHLTVNNDGGEIVRSGRIALSRALQYMPPGQVVGTTAYNYQMNYMLKDRIIYDPVAQTIHVSWMWGDISETNIGFPNRRMYYNYFDGTSWTHILGVPIESVRSGYGALEIAPNGAAVMASHFGDGVNIFADFSPGFGFFQQHRIWNRPEMNPDLNPTWPDIAIDGNGVWHVVATNFNDENAMPETLNDVENNVMYWRSEDQGTTWSEFTTFFPDTITFPVIRGKEALNSKMIEASDTDANTIGVVIADNNHDFYFFESENAGQDWNPGFKVIGNPLIAEDDSLTYPMTWYAVIMDSTEFGGIRDTLLGDNLEPGMSSRPNGEGDLLYVDGEPHLVWTELYYLPSFTYYPWGLTTELYPTFKFWNGDSVLNETSFFVKHWSPSTGVSTVYEEVGHSARTWWSGNSSDHLSDPQVGIDPQGNMYCVFVRYSLSDTLKPEDGITQTDADQGPLSFGRIWGAKSSDGGSTWFDAVQLTPEDESIHYDCTTPSISNMNQNETIHLLYMSTPNVPGTVINEDHTVWAEANMMYMPVPTSTFPSVKTVMHGPEIEYTTNSTIGGLNFGDIGDSGTSEMPLLIRNTGDADLVVGPLFSSHRAFQAFPSEFTVPPGGEQTVNVTFMPYNDQPYSEFLIIPNNDASEFSAAIPLKGVGLPTSVQDYVATAPDKCVLEQNYPNPFNPQTSIQFELQNQSHVVLEILNVKGEWVTTLVDDSRMAGSYLAVWDGRNEHGINMPSGVYLYRLSAGDFLAIRKMLLVR